jgi:aerobic-type carbon monoxide dehydrogenase small subunit (CoxS/CutS family)
MKINLIVNGHRKGIDVEPNTLLINVLRNDLMLTGTKYGCGIGECGACTVLLDEESILACMTLALDVDGRRIDTIEGLNDGDRLHPIQEAYLDEGAVQCGFCTPGFIMSTKALLSENIQPNEQQIREYLKGNMCRCTGYVNIVKAVKTAATKMKGTS